MAIIECSSCGAKMKKYSSDVKLGKFLEEERTCMGGKPGLFNRWKGTQIDLMKEIEVTYKYVLCDLCKSRIHLTRVNEKETGKTREVEWHLD